MRECPDNFDIPLTRPATWKKDWRSAAMTEKRYFLAPTLIPNEKKIRPERKYHMYKAKIIRPLGLCAVMSIALLSTKGMAIAQDDKPCLAYAYPKGQASSAEAQFDKSYDTLNVHRASFSCGPAIAASQARDALESFRYGVLYHDSTRLNTV